MGSSQEKVKCSKGTGEIHIGNRKKIRREYNQAEENTYYLNNKKGIRVLLL